MRVFGDISFDIEIMIISILIMVVKIRKRSWFEDFDIRIIGFDGWERFLFYIIGWMVLLFIAMGILD